MSVPHPYKPLFDFITGYLHQDWMLDDASLDEVVARFLGDCGPAEGVALRADIARLRLEHRNDLDRMLTHEFGEGVAYQSGWDMTAAEWLDHLDGLLRRAMSGPESKPLTG